MEKYTVNIQYESTSIVISDITVKIDENLGLDTLAERIIVHRKDSDESYILSKVC